MRIRTGKKIIVIDKNGIRSMTLVEWLMKQKPFFTKEELLTLNTPSNIPEVLGDLSSRKNYDE